MSAEIARGVVGHVISSPSLVTATERCTVADARMVELDAAVEHADAHAGARRAAPGPVSRDALRPLGRQEDRLAGRRGEAPGGKLFFALVVREHGHAADLRQ